MEQPKLQTRNQMSATKLIITENSELNFEKSKKDPSKVYFRCGTKSGYISPAVKAKLNTVKLEELQYAECKKAELPDIDENGKSNWVPCLMMVGSHVTRQLGVDLLH